MAKQAAAKRIEKFRRDLEHLKEKYRNDEIAKKLGSGAGNLSSYGSGSKNPGEGFLNRFYAVFGEEIKQLGYFSERSQNDVQHSKVDESQFRYSRKSSRELIDMLKSNNDFLRINFGKIVESNRDLAESIKNMSQANLILAELLNKKGS
ncbi:MAG TPA: hypothetical protein VHC96_14115 [Puia sp.]|nr:hypothetical protein [Puia sp.]